MCNDFVTVSAIKRKLNVAMDKLGDEGLHRDIHRELTMIDTRIALRNDYSISDKEQIIVDGIRRYLDAIDKGVSENVRRTSLLGLCILMKEENIDISRFDILKLKMRTIFA